MPRAVIKVANSLAGGSNNLAVVNVDGTQSVGRIAANWIALYQYSGPAAGTSIESVDEAPVGGGPTMPVQWTAIDAVYFDLRVGNPALANITNFGVEFGNSTLSVLGAGAVVSRHTLTPGRSGRGRFTCPWISAEALDSLGEMGAGARQNLLVACENYMLGNGTFGALSIGPLLWSHKTSSAHPIVTFSVSSRLGRLRSRSR